MKYKITAPLELKKDDTWCNIEHICIAGVSPCKEEVIRKISDVIDRLFNKTSYVVIWDFGKCIDGCCYTEMLCGMNLIYRTDYCLIYKTESNQNLKEIINIWGECDVLDIICLKTPSYMLEVIENGFYRKYSEYRTAFLDRVNNSSAVLSDSGDGEEFQLIIKSGYLSEKEFVKMLDLNATDPSTKNE